MFEFTEKEKLLLEAIDKSSTVSMASHNLIYGKGQTTMTPQACYQMLHRIRARYLEARSYTNTILALRQRSPLSKKVLTPKVAVD